MTTATQQFTTADRVAQAQELLAHIRRDVGTATGAVRSIATELPVGGDSAVQAIDNAARQTNDALTEIQALINEPGVPDDLVAVGAVWSGPVQSAVTDIKSTINTSELAAARLWKGQAASAYNAILIPQQNALTNIADACTEINSSLNDLAGDLDTFWWQTLGALVGLAAAAAGLVVALLSPAAGAAAGVAVSGAIITFCIGMATYFAMSGVATSGLDAAVTSTKAVLQNRVGNQTGFPGGHWPQATHVTAHASFADDKRPSDWQIVD